MLLVDRSLSAKIRLEGVAGENVDDTKETFVNIFIVEYNQLTQGVADAFCFVAVQGLEPGGLRAFHHHKGFLPGLDLPEDHCETRLCHKNLMQACLHLAMSIAMLICPSGLHQQTLAPCAVVLSVPNGCDRVHTRAIWLNTCTH